MASIACPMRPPSASISRTRWPFAVPPTAGLHGISATVSADSVHRPTRQPRRAAAHAASQPAWPAPMTMTSKCSDKSTAQVAWLGARLLPNAELAEDVPQQIFRRPASRDLLERAPRIDELREQQLLSRATLKRRLRALHDVSARPSGGRGDARSTPRADRATPRGMSARGRGDAEVVSIPAPVSADTSTTRVLPSRQARRQTRRGADRSC